MQEGQEGIPAEINEQQRCFASEEWTSTGAALFFLWEFLRFLVKNLLKFSIINWSQGNVKYSSGKTDGT